MVQCDCLYCALDNTPHMQLSTIDMVSPTVLINSIIFHFFFMITIHFFFFFGYFGFAVSLPTNA